MFARRVLAVVLLFAGAALAQTVDRVEIFGGYSFAPRDFSGGTIGQGGLKAGWNASVNFKFSRIAGLMADVSGYYKHQGAGSCNGGLTSCSAHVYTAMFGPQLTLPLPKIKPFAHALFGVAVAGQNGTAPANPFTGNTEPAVALGGGVDFSLSRHIALRGQGDYLLTHFTYSDNQLHFSNNNARISAGVVFRF